MQSENRTNVLCTFRNGERLGSFKFVRDKIDVIAISDGTTLKEPYFKLRSKVRELTYKIVPVSNKHYKIKSENETLAIIKRQSIFNLEQFIIVIEEKVSFYFFREDYDYTNEIDQYRILLNQKKVGYVRAQNWREEIHINLWKNIPLDPILCIVPIISTLKRGKTVNNIIRLY